MDNTKIDWADSTWNPVPCYPGYYASANGEILSSKKGTPKILKQIKSNDGYLYVFMYVGGVQHKMRVHRAVLLAWKGAPADGEECRHLDDNPSNNNINNLAWGTRLENVNDKKNNGRMPEGEKSGSHKLSESDVKEIRLLHGKITLRELSKIYGVSHTAIRRAALGIKWACVREGLV
ncbi:MAG TPA: HNH endonuclease [Candidatus Omnitrophota bacterium]|nr:HNH endonuclease [Candidatus Omnitrophota bacterium]